jgi:transcriptional regulator with XRE-family HTH domain
MEQTLGKRIQSYRKQQSMTQGKLAEALGVTAQAVSKWENDQSCPDINMLPKLAQIFGITTDELLEHTVEPVHEAQIVGDAQSEEEEDGGLHVHKGNWEFKYEVGKRGSIFFALLWLTVGALSLASRALNWDVSFWSILWPTALLVFGLNILFDKFSFFSIGCTLFGGYFLLDNLNVISLDLGDMIFPIIIVLFGISLLADALRKPKKRRWIVKHDGKPVNGETRKNTCTTEGEHFACDMSFGDGRQDIMMPRLASGEIDCSFGDFTVDLSGCETITEDCRIEVDCSFGEVTILVPSHYRVLPETDTTFASTTIDGIPDIEPVGTIRMECDVSFGQVTIRYI